MNAPHGMNARHLAPNGDNGDPTGEFGDVAGMAALVKVVRGDVDEEELAALVAGIVAARMASLGEEVDDGSRTSVWGDPRRRWGVPVRPSRAAWRWSTHRA